MSKLTQILNAGPPVISGSVRRMIATTVIPLAAAFALQPVAMAAPSYSGTVNGHFDNAVLSGNVVAIDRSLVFLDNSATAVFFRTTLSPSNDTITWGNNPASSFLNFVGADFSNVAPDTPFLLGHISYLNGTSNLASLIFGATLHLDLGSGITPKTSLINIVTTQNTGLSPERDSDFIGFSDLPQTFNVFENGFSIVNIYGQVVGDPEVSLTSIAVADGFGGSGFIGNGIGAVPEPAAWALMLSGFGLVGVSIRRRRAFTAGRAYA
jgi:PEP-CTERM motif